MFTNRLFKQLFGTVAAVALLSGCAIFDKKDTDQESNWLLRQFEKDGNKQADEATVAYSQGNFRKSQELVNESLKDNPRNQQALLVGALTAEKLGRPNRARQFYEDLILIGGDNKTVLGTTNGVPEKITDIARRRLRVLTIQQSKLVVENPNGTKSFNISKEAGAAQSKENITKAYTKKTASKPSSRANIGSLFSSQEQNIISRFLILKELAEKDLITKDEFLSRRMSNIGGLLPLTHSPAATGIDAPVPSPDLIIERIDVLKEAVESRAITPQEFSAERDTIIEALLPPNPRTRMKPTAPAKDILGAAKNLRKLEVLYDLNLITSAEKTAEHKAIEKYLGINRAPAQTPQPTPAVNALVQTEASVSAVNVSAQPENLAPAPQQISVTTEVKEVSVPTQPAPAESISPVAVETVSQAPVETVSVPQGLQPAPIAAPQQAPQDIAPNVSSPF